MGMTTEQRREAYDKGVIHKNRKLLGETRLTRSPFNEKHDRAQLYLLESLELFNDVCKEYPLKNAERP